MPGGDEPTAGKYSHTNYYYYLLSWKWTATNKCLSYIAWPIADEALTQNLLDLVQQSSHYRQLKKGANEGE